jgi:ribosome biogenesis GTPase
VTAITKRNKGPLLQGQVVASHGRGGLVELSSGALLDCATRGKRGGIACGDHVSVRDSGGGTGVIEAITPRKSILYRSDAHHEKLIAANVTQAVIVVAPVPSWHDDLVNRCLAACEQAGIKPLIVLNKADLPQSATAWEALAVYRTLGYEMLHLCAKQDASPLAARLQGHVSVLVGQSGMGKSTLINAVIPGSAQRVAGTSLALDSGKHTTTGARLLHLDANSHVIDSPGLQVFGLHHLTLEETTHAFRELREWMGHCRFRDCTHRSEPDCAVTQACTDGRIAPARLATYRALVEERLRAHAGRYR